MSYTLLLDLDDTLLRNDIDVFLRYYLGAWGKVMAPYMDPEQFVRVLLGATKAMTSNRNPGCTLQESFEAAFFPKLGMDESAFRALAERFYREVFPSLGQYTAPMPGAQPLVEAALQRGYPIAIATNPLFPAEAIRQRLIWADLSPDAYPFDLVASYETLHFAKPDPAFYAEVLARLGWPDQPAVLVGDDMENEVAAGRKLGLPVYWLPKDGLTPAAGLAPTAQGSLEGVLPWLDAAAPETLAADFNSPTALTAILRSTLAAFDTFLRSRPADAWNRRPATDEWSVSEILCHMRDVEAEVNLPRLRTVLAENNPFIAGQDTDAWAEQRGYARQDGRQAWRAFFSARMELVEILEGLDDAAWQRTARHAIFGPSRLIEIISIQAAHDRAHVKQVLKQGDRGQETGDR